MINEMLKQIDEEIEESEFHVLESMLITYNKAYDLLTNSDESTIDSFNVIQEAAAEEDGKKDDNSKGIISKIISAIIKFFKGIGNAIASFTKNTKDTIVDRLRKFGKSSGGNADEAQEKADAVSDRVSEKHANKAKEDLTESDKGSSKDGKSDKKTGVDVKERKIKTKINFEGWIQFLDDVDEYFSADFIKSNIDIKPHKYSTKKPKCYYLFSHKFPATKVADYVEKITAKLKSVNTSLDACQEKLAKMQELIKSGNNLSVYKTTENAWKNDRKHVEQNIRNMSDDVSTAFYVIQNMTLYLADELKIYGVILDAVEPILSKEKTDNKVEEKKDNE